ncbi:MAG TPA: 50S ribosomal protein L6 [Myxococcales bacterium]|nr:50S ribosomal protein L6 [Myxococcales bacterium]HAN32128.1 50S ribosomal protein L6 [Myxococcales bacterium]
MSRIGKAPVPVPSGTTVTVQGDDVTVKGPKGTLSRSFKGVTFEQSGSDVIVHPKDTSRSGKALHGLGRALLNNMVIGCAEGFKRELDVQGVGFRIDQKGSDLVFQVGFSHNVSYTLPAGVKGKVEKQTHLILESCDKELIGQTAASIRSIRPPEPYKGKGIRYTDEVVRRKAGKSGAKG